MKEVKERIPRKLRDGIPLTIRPGHTVLLEITEEPLTVYSGLSLFYAMAETLEIPRSLDQHVHIKQREKGYPESEHILALAANAFLGGDFLEDLEALREDVAIKNKAVPFLRQFKRQVPPSVTEVNICSDSAFYNKEVVMSERAAPVKTFLASSFERDPSSSRSRRSHLYALPTGMRMSQERVAIKVTSLVGLSKFFRAYAPVDDPGSRYGSRLVSTQYAASAR